jgi:hypothetical protein
MSNWFTQQLVNHYDTEQKDEGKLQDITRKNALTMFPRLRRRILTSRSSGAGETRRVHYML